MDGIGDLLRFLVRAGADVAEAAVGAAGASVDATVNATRSGLLRLPRSLKDVLLWLACCCSDENKKGLLNVIKKTLGVNNINGFMALSGILGEDLPQGTYENATWSQLCPRGGSTKCCASGGEGCSDCQASKNQGSCDGCCAKCPKQICARIFCLLVPILYYFLDYLAKKCKTDWSTQKPNDSNDSDLKNFWVTSGLPLDNIEEAITGKEVAEGLRKLVSQLKEVKDEIYNARSRGRSLFISHDEHKSNTSNLPSTLPEFLQWLLFLPYCSDYSKVLQSLQRKIGHKNEQLLSGLFKPIIERVSMILLFVEGKGGTQSGIFTKMDHLTKGYYPFAAECYSTENATRILLFLLPLLQWALGKTSEINCSEQNCKLNECDNMKSLLKSCGWTVVLSPMKCSDFTGYLKKYLLSPKGVLLTLKSQLATAWRNPRGSQGTSQSHSGTHEPRTIRGMMLWLQGLHSSGVFGEMLEEAKKRLSNIGITDSSAFSTIVYKFSDFLFMLPGLIHAIEGGFGSCIKDLIKHVVITTGDEATTNAFSYGNSGAECLSMFVKYTYQVHSQLRFLMTMCKESKENGGWQECKYANGQCTCTGNVASCLKDFLQNGNNQGGSGNKFKLTNGSQEEHLKMGFKQYPTGNNGSITGNDITPYLEPLLDEIPTQTSQSSKPLSLLTQYCVAIGQLHPQSLGDLFAFFAHLGQSWDSLKLYNNGVEKFKNKLTVELENYKIGQNGDQQACSELQNKIKAILTTHSDHSKARSLQSLMCNGNSNTGGASSNGCAPYMKSLSQGVYQYYCPQITGAGDSKKFGVFQYLYDMLRKLLDKMKELKEAFDACECCQPGKPCDGLISCPNAHPILYKFGFVFGDPSKLKSGSSKKCPDIKAQLTAVLSCKKDHESALFKAFECVIQVTYKVLLEKAKEKVNEKYDTKSNGTKTAGGLKSTNQEMNTAFTLYVHNAMYQSYPKLICTFACKVFDGNHQCKDNKCNEFREQIVAPAKTIPSSAPITVSSSAVTAITAVIPHYTAPVIDPYHYRTFQKNNSQAGASATGTSTSYSFQSALDFHVKGANCIRPTPVALRSVIDWILRITVGNKDGNNDNISEHIKGLSKAIQEVFQESGTTDTDGNVQQYVIDLVSGLRKFMGYTDRSTDVIKGVQKELGDGTNGTNGVKKLLGDEIQKITDFIGEKGKENFGKELGKALLKGQYAFKETDALETLVDMAATLVDTLLGSDAKKNIHVRKNFKDAVKTFSDILEAKHTHCTVTNCKDFNKDSSSKSSSNVNAEGLSQLHTFFSELQKFAALWTTIGKQKGNGGQGGSGSRGTSPSQGPSSSLVRHSCIDAEAEIYCELKNKIDPFVTSYFSRLQMHINLLGKCAEKVNDLKNNNGSPSSDSKAYRTKITQLIKELKEALEYLKGIPLDYVVDGSNKLLQITKGKVDIAIPYSIKTAIVESVYCKIQCSQNSKHPRHQNMSGVLCIQSLITLIEGVINSKCNEFKSHLDDLKQLCQWLYRMGQLYAHGLKGFVESLISHLGHIIQTIKWIEGIEKMMTKLKDIDGKDKLCETISGFDDIKDCCQNSGHQSLCNGSNKFTSRDGFFTALNCRIDNLLTSYVLGPLPEGNSDKTNDTQNVEQRRQLLSEIRLLALDRYTLQVWEDECNDKDCNIKDWITFEGGIVRHSNLGDIKEALQNLTGVAYNNASSAPSPANRIQNFHAICVIQKFSYQEPIKLLEESLKELKGIQGQLSAVKQKCDEKNGTQLKDDDTVIKPFCQLVDAFLKDPYGVYSFAKFVHTIMGPNVFSAVIGAMEDVKSTNELSGEDKKKKFCGIVKVMHEGLESDTERQNDYKLAEIITKLSAFITTLRREYIFAYPVVTANKASLPAPAPPAQKKAELGIPTCPNRDHSMSSICKQCYHYLARIFIGSIPNLYRHCRLLYEMCDIGPGYWYNDILSMGYEDYYNRYMLSLSGFMSHQGYEVLTRGKDIPSSSSMFMILPRLSIGHPYCIDGITTHYTVYRAIL